MAKQLVTMVLSDPDRRRCLVEAMSLLLDEQPPTRRGNTVDVEIAHRTQRIVGR